MVFLKKTQKKAKNEKEFDKFDLGNAISAHECTGLIQRPPQTEDEEESYMAIADYKAPNSEIKKREEK